MPTQLPFDFETQQASLKRRQGIIDAMTARLLTPQQGQMISNSAGTFYAGGGLASALTPILGAMAMDKSQKELEADQAGVSQKYNEGLKGALDTYERTRTGAPAKMVPSMAPTIDNDPNNPKMVPDPANPAVAGDPRRAAIEAIVSSYGPMKELGMSDLKESSKNAVTMKDLLPYANPTSIPGLLTKGVMGFAPKSELGEVNGVVYDKNNRSIVELGGPQPTQVAQNGDLYEKSPSTGALRKLDNAPKVTVSPQISVLNKGTSELVAKLADIAAKDYGTAAESAQSAQRALDNVAKLRSLGPTFTGPSSNAAVFTTQLAQSLGVPVDAKKLANSETFESESAQAWINMMNAAGGSRGLVREESDRIARAVPALVHSPEGRAQLMQMIEDRAKKTIEVAGHKRKALIEAGKADNPALYLENVTGAPPMGIPASSPINGGKSTVSGW